MAQGDPRGQHWGGSQLQGRGGDVGEGRVNTPPYRYNAQSGGSRKLGWVSTEAFLSLTSTLTPL